MHNFEREDGMRRRCCSRENEVREVERKRRGCIGYGNNESRNGGEARRERV